MASDEWVERGQGEVSPDFIIIIDNTPCVPKLDGWLPTGAPNPARHLRLVATDITWSCAGIAASYGPRRLPDWERTPAPGLTRLAPVPAMVLERISTRPEKWSRSTAAAGHTPTAGGTNCCPWVSGGWKGCRPRNPVGWTPVCGEGHIKCRLGVHDKEPTRLVMTLPAVALAVGLAVGVAVGRAVRVTVTVT
jgi:hypothetical protein